MTYKVHCTMGPETLGTIRQFITAFFASLSGLITGSGFMWVTPLIPHLLSKESEVPMSSDELSWVLALIEIGDIFTPIPAAILADRLGRKPILLTSGPLHFAAWILIIFTRSVPALYAARLIQGLALGVQYAVLPIYLGEIAGPKIRGSIGIFVQYSWYIGIIFQYAIGPFLKYDEIMWASLSLTVLFMGTFVWFPESPYYLIMRGKEKKALKVLKWLRGAGDAEQEELEKEMGSMKLEIESQREKTGGWAELVGTRQGRVGLALGVAVMATCLMGGVLTTLSYASITFSPGAQVICSLVVGALLLVSVPAMGYLMDRAGRRPVLIVSSGISAAASAIIGLYFLFRPTFLPHIVVDVLIIIYVIFLAAGVESVFPILQSELFPTSTRAMGSAVMIIASCFFSFASLKSYDWFLTHVGLYSNFFVFSGFCLFGFLVIYFYLPETKGKTFEEIQKSF